MRDYIYTDKRNTCPVCGNHHGCKIWNDGKIWCLRTTHPSDVPHGYRFLGELSGGMGGCIVPDDTSEKEYHRRQNQQEKEEQKEKQTSLSKLSIQERDKAIRAIHSYCGISRGDRLYLKEVRGLSDEQIDHNLYFTIDAYQELPHFIPLNFPGVRYDGKNLVNKYGGIACVTFNIEGKATGIQIRLRDEKIEGGKYRWLSGAHKPHLPNGELPLTIIKPTHIKSPHIALVEGTGFKPQIAAGKLGQIVIGAAGGQHGSSPIQLKEFLKAAKEHIGDCFENPQENIIQIYLDAGDIKNNHVMNRVGNIISLLESWEYGVEIAWWGQTTKEHDDIDELSDLGAIQYIPQEQFEPLTQFKHNQARKNSLTTKTSSKGTKPKQDNRNLKTKTSSNKKYNQEIETEFFDYSSTLEMLDKSLFLLGSEVDDNIYEILELQKSLKNYQKQENSFTMKKIKYFFKIEQFLSFFKNLIKALKIVVLPENNPQVWLRENCQELWQLKTIYLGLGNLQFAQQIKEIAPGIELYFIDTTLSFEDALAKKESYAEKKVKSYKDFTLFNQTINSRYLGEIKRDHSSQTVFLQTPMASGKTYSMAQEIQENWQAHQIGTMAFVHRESLAIQLAKRFNLPYRTKLPSNGEWREKGYSACMENGHKYANPSFMSAMHYEKNVVIDECSQVMRSLLLSPTYNNHRMTVLKSLYQLGKGMKLKERHFTLADADLDDLTINFWSKLLSIDIQTSKIVNSTYATEILPDCYVIENRDKLFSELMNQLKAGKRIIFFTSAQQAQYKNSTQVIEAMVKQELPHLKILRMDRESNGDPTHDAHTILKQLHSIHNYDLVIMSPVLETGISIELPPDETKKFDAIFGYFGGTQLPEACSQTLGRLRYGIPAYVFIAAKGSFSHGDGSISPGQFKYGQDRQLRAILKEFDCASLCDPEVAEIYTLAIETISKLVCLQNYQAKHYKECVMEQIARTRTIKSLKEDIKEEELLLEEKKELYTAKDVKEIRAEVSENLYLSRCEAIASTPNPDDETYKELEHQREFTPLQRYALKKGQICRSVGVDDNNITPELVKLFDEGIAPALRLRYYSTVGFKYAKKRDEEKLDMLYTEAQGDLLPHDLIPKIKYPIICLLSKLKLSELPNYGAKADLRKWIAKHILPHRKEIKLYFNIWFQTGKQANNNGQLKDLLLKIGFDLNLRVEFAYDCYQVEDMATSELLTIAYTHFHSYEDKQAERDLKAIEAAKNLIFKIKDFANLYQKTLPDSFWEYAQKYKYRSERVLQKLAKIAAPDDEDNTIDAITEEVYEKMELEMRSHLAKIFKYDLLSSTVEIWHTFQKNKTVTTTEPIGGKGFSNLQLTNNNIYSGDDRPILYPPNQGITYRMDHDNETARIRNIPYRIGDKARFWSRALIKWVDGIIERFFDDGYVTYYPPTGERKEYRLNEY